MQTGLPPNVDACAPGFQSITLARAIIALSGMPEAMPLARANDVRLDSSVFAGPPLSCAAHSRLHFVRDEQDSVLAADALQTLQELCRRGQVAALALNRLDENSGDFFGIDAAAEQFVFEVAQAILGSALGAHAIRAAIGVRIRHVKDAGEQRAKAFALNRSAGRKRERAHACGRGKRRGRR